MESKQCSKCKKIKPLEEFGNLLCKKDGKRSACKLCHKNLRGKNSKWKGKYDPLIVRNKRLKKDYGLSGGDYDLILKKQGGRCAICRMIPLCKPLDVDHDHDTGIVRGLLCSSCNHGLGQFRDDIDYLARAISYLQQSIVNENKNHAHSSCSSN